MDLQTKLDNLPTSPGVYLMKNDQGEIIYVGKAINLRNRVRSYFRELKPDQAKTKALVKHIVDLEYILADNELEALVLECNLIKKYRPKYNINLKDDKTYPYLKITNEPYPQVIVTRKVTKDGARYFGPYPSVNELRNSLEMIRKIFPFRSCKQRTFTNERPCLNAHIKMCHAPCVGRISKEDYNAMIDEIALFFDGKQDGLTKRLQKEMEEAAEKMEYEKAARFRDKIKSIERISARQKVVVEDSTNEDVFAIAQRGNKACLAVLCFREGLLANTEHFIIDYSENLADTRYELITSYYSSGRQIPPLIVVDGDVTDKELIEEYLSQRRQKKVAILKPQRGEKVRVMEMCLQNAAQKLGEHLGRAGRETAVLDELAKILVSNS